MIDKHEPQALGPIAQDKILAAPQPSRLLGLNVPLEKPAGQDMHAYDSNNSIS